MMEGCWIPENPKYQNTFSICLSESFIIGAEYKYYRTPEAGNQLQTAL